MLIMDSGLGGISVVRALRAAQPGIALHYLADTGAFPYGKRSAAEITARATAILQTLAPHVTQGGVVLACNTLSTLCLDTLRQRFSLPFVGTVPAVKVAAGFAKRFTLLATPNTADSPYSKNLIAEFASDCVVDRYGAPIMAAMAEAALLGASVDAVALRAELAPAFHDDENGRTQAIVLGCTHYPLILDALRAAAPWEVQWVDSSEAIARRALSQCRPADSAGEAFLTSHANYAAYETVFRREGFARTTLFEHPLRIDGAV